MYMFLFVGSLFTFVFPLILFTGILFFAFLKKQERETLQKEIIDEYLTEIDAIDYFAVKYSSEKKFSKIIKIVSWEASGVLFLTKEKLIFIRRYCFEKDKKLVFKLEETRFEWLGSQNLFKNGFVSYFRVEGNDRNHYFTSETGTTIFGSRNSTEAIYKSLRLAMKTS